MRRGQAGWKRFERMNRPPAGEPFIWLTRELIESPAWRQLSKPALRFITRLMVEHMNHGGTENGRLICTYDQLVAFGISRKHISDAIALAVDLGFVDLVQRGHRGYGIAKQPSIYALTWLPRMDGSAPTNRWKLIISPAPKRELKPVPKRELARTPNGNWKPDNPEQSFSAQTGTALNISTAQPAQNPKPNPEPALVRNGTGVRGRAKDWGGSRPRPAGPSGREASHRSGPDSGCIDHEPQQCGHPAQAQLGGEG